MTGPRRLPARLTNRYGKIEPGGAIPKEIAELLKNAFDKGGCHEICEAIGEAIKLYNVTEIAAQTGLRRESLYKSFAGRYHNPNLRTLVLVLDAMGFRLQLKKVDR